jgi:hypothetical protein
LKTDREAVLRLRLRDLVRPRGGLGGSGRLLVLAAGREQQARHEGVQDDGRSSARHGVQAPFLAMIWPITTITTPTINRS